MKKKDLAELFAKETKLPAGAAADELDDALHSVLKSRRHNERPKVTALERLLREAKCAPARKERNSGS
jgi:hypothetical protein